MASYTLPQAGIYCIKNLINGRVYVGSSARIRRRLTGHRCLLRKNAHDSPKLQYGWNHYGEDAFEFSILETVSGPEAELLAREQHWIDKLHAADPECGYNTSPIAGTRRGVPQPPGHAELISSINKGRVRSHETRQRMTQAALQRPPEHNEKIAASLLGKPLSDHHRQRISEVRLTSDCVKAAMKAVNAKKRKLTDDQVRIVIAMRENDEPMKKIADAIGVSRRVVRAILSGETYGEVTGLSSTA